MRWESRSAHEKGDLLEYFNICHVNFTFMKQCGYTTKTTVFVVAVDCHSSCWQYRRFDTRS